MGKKKIKVTYLTENDILIRGSKEYTGLTISSSPGRVNIIGSDGLFESVPVNSHVWVKTK